MSIVEKFRSHLMAKTSSNQTCPSCGSSNFGIEENMGAISNMDPETQKLTGQAVAVMFIQCTDCGRIMVFNAKIAGVV